MEPSRADLATPISQIVLSPRVALVFVKSHVFEQIRPQEATWAEVSPTWAPKRGPKGSPRGSQKGAKKEKKNEVKSSRVKAGKRGVQPDLA